MDKRYHDLAEVLTGFSTNVKKDDHVLIDGYDIPQEMLVTLIRAVRKRKAHPYVQMQSARIVRELYGQSSSAQLETIREVELARMKKMDAYIALRGASNIFEMSDVPSKKMAQALKALKPVLDQRIKKTKWCVLRWPTPAMAQQARMSTEAFEDFFFNVCTLDYARMKSGMKALSSWMDRTDRVEIKGASVDLTFSIKDIPSVMCGGRHNIPDGEVFTAPVRDSVNGYIAYNTPTVYQGTSFDGVRLEFENGKIVNATAGTNQKRLRQILDSDEGARYIGEFAIGFNPYIKEPMRDILFDEKIAGSFHFTPGQAYEDADNGNKSQVHWDMVYIQRKDYGGGRIYFDGKLIRDNGYFLPKSLQKLNPDYLLGRKTKATGKKKKGKKSSRQ